MPDDQQSLGASATLTAGVSSGATTLPLSTAIGVADGRTMRVVCEGEVLLVTAGMGTTSLTVTRGQEGTTAAAHPSGATVQQRLTPAGLANTRTQPNPHAHNGTDGSGTVAHSATTGRTANDHHNQAHAIGGADHTGTLAHTALSAIGTNTHPQIDTHIADTGIHGGGGGGDMSSFTLAGDGGTPQTITDTNTLTVAGGSGLVSAAGATDTVTLDLDINSLAADASPDGAADYVATWDASAGAHKKVLLDDLPGGGGGSGLYSAYLCYQDQKTSGTNGGTFTSGANRTRNLNTEVADSAGIGSVASDQITITGGGTFDVLASAPAYFVQRHQLLLWDVTNGATLLVGTSEFATNSGAGVQNRSWLAGPITLAGTVVLELRHRAQDTVASNGFGVSVGASFTVDHETYASIELRKRA
jgi:hypothetical protein